ncbi:MAG TPA: hypothetical protein VFY37_07510 [Solirubrobacterales bacterium]|nr:hypothetical protein [Solirubrobacterales bacterium]
MILTGIASVVIRSAPPESTAVAVAGFPAESGYTWVFAMGAAGAALLLVVSMAMPGRRSLS